VTGNGRGPGGETDGRRMRRRELESARNPRLSLVRKLALRRHREKAGLFVAEGPHAAEAALDAGARARDVFCTEGFLEHHPGLAERLERCDWPVWTVSEGVMRGLATTEHSQGLLCVVERLPDAAEPLPGPGLLALALEGVGDPGNLGSLLRAAHAAGATVVILGPGCCDRFNAKAVRASAGALFRVAAMATEDLAGLLGRLHEGGARVVVGDPKGDRRVWDSDLRSPLALVVGSEAHGLSPAVRAVADETVGIPMPGGAESLNAAAAAAVLLYEVVRQRAVEG